MKQDDKLYNEWLDEVRNVQPILSNPDELTTAILQQVSRIVPQKKKRKSLLIGSWVSGIAAGLLLCLLVSETLLSPVPDGVRVEEEHRFQENSAYSLPEGWERMRLSEKSDYLSGQYVQYKKLRQKRVMELTKKTY